MFNPVKLHRGRPHTIVAKLQGAIDGALVCEIRDDQAASAKEEDKQLLLLESKDKACSRGKWRRWCTALLVEVSRRARCRFESTHVYVGTQDIQLGEIRRDKQAALLLQVAVGGLCIDKRGTRRTQTSYSR